MKLKSKLQVLGKFCSVVGNVLFHFFRCHFSNQFIFPTTKTIFTPSNPNHWLLPTIHSHSSKVPTFDHVTPNCVKVALDKLQLQSNSRQLKKVLSKPDDICIVTKHFCAVPPKLQLTTRSLKIKSFDSCMRLCAAAANVPTASNGKNNVLASSGLLPVLPDTSVSKENSSKNFVNTMNKVSVVYPILFLFIW